MTTTLARVVELVSRAATELGAAGIPTARTDAEWLLAGVLGVGRFEAYVDRARAVDEATVERYTELVHRRAAGEPLQHLLGWEAFRGVRLRVTPEALVPRPETEALVEWALALLPRGPAVVVDVGTGSGCIACALAHERHDVRVLGVDVSPDAARLAGDNVARLGLGRRVAVVIADLLHTVADASADLVIANPPYLSPEALAAAPREVRDWEPRLALLGGADGLEVLRRVVADAGRVLKPSGALVVETAGPDQVAAVSAMLDRNGFGDLALRPDLAGTIRFVAGRAPGPRRAVRRHRDRLGPGVVTP